MIGRFEVRLLSLIVIAGGVVAAQSPPPRKDIPAITASNSVDYIHLYSGDKDTLTESLEHVQRASAEILSAIMTSE